MANVISDRKLAWLAEWAGWKGHDIQVAVAVALAESRGNAQAHNTTPPDDSYGLWQINLHGDLKNRTDVPEGSRKNPELLFGPGANAVAAYSVWRAAGNSWLPWSTYTNLSYRLFLPRAAKAAADPVGMTPRELAGETGRVERPELPFEDPIGDVIDTIKGIGNFVGFVTDPGNWRRVAMFVGGGALIIVAAVAAFGDELASAIPAGKVAGKVAKRL